MRASRNRQGVLGRVLLLAVALAGAVGHGARADGPPSRTLNGFSLEKTSIPVDKILRGGPPRDGIPALNDPKFVRADQSPWTDDQMVIGVAWDGEARAYPLQVLVWHELVNDQLAGRPILVSYCPLCGTGLVFDRRVAGQARRFGVSGLLYQSDLLMYDRESESLWSQVSARAETGPALGTRLALVRSRMDLWGNWKRDHPETTVLSRETGHARDYGRSPYGDYDQSTQLFFPVARDPRYHPKMPTLGLRLPGGAARAYPADELVRAGGHVEETFENRRVAVSYDPNTHVFQTEAPGSIEVIEGFWFAWAAFHPQTSVFTAPAEM